MIKDNKLIVKCDRCRRIRDLFQYTHFEEDNWVEVTVDLGFDHSPRYEKQRVNLAQSRGLCEECAVELNKRTYDIAQNITTK